MPDEQTPATASTPSFKARFEALIQDPYRLLVISVYMIAVGGLLLAIIDVAGWAEGATEAFEYFMNDFSLTVISVSIVVGIIAVIHGVRQRKGAAPTAAPASLQQGLTNPVWLLNIAPDVILAMGGVNLLFFLIDSYELGLMQLFSRIFDILFRVSFAFFIVVTLKYISDWLHGTMRAAPVVAEGATPTLKQRYWQFVTNPDRFLFFGLLFTVYMILLELVFETASSWDAGASLLWREYFEHMAEAAGAAVFLIVARALVNWLTGTDVSGGRLARGSGEQVWAWLRRITSNPRLALDAMLLLALVGGLPFYIVDIWSARGEATEFFWIIVLEDTLFGVSIIGSLLVLRAFAVHLVGDTTGSYRDRLAGAAAGPFYNDPGRLLRLIVFLIPFIGLTYISLTTWDWRGEGFWIVWYYFFLVGGEMMVPLAIFLGGRVLYDEVWTGTPEAMASAANGVVTHEPVGAGATSGSDSGAAV